MKAFAYVRERNGQEVDPEVLKKELRGSGVRERNIIVEPAGEDAQFREMLKQLEAGDLVVLDSLLSLGKNNAEIATGWEEIRMKRHANVKVLDMEFLDTRIQGRDVGNLYVADLTMQVFGEVSAKTVKIRKDRQAEGIAAAKKKGVQFGSKKKELPPEFEMYKEMYLKGEIKGCEAARLMNISRSTFFYRVNH